MGGDSIIDPVDDLILDAWKGEQVGKHKDRDKNTHPAHGNVPTSTHRVHEQGG